MFLETLKRTAVASCLGLGLLSAQAQNDELPQKGSIMKMSTLPVKELYNSQVVYEAKEAELKNFLLQGWRYDRRKNCLSTGRYTSNTDVKAISKPFTVPALAKGEQLYLNITEAYSLESHYDYGKVLLSDDGGTTWRSIHRVSGESDKATSQINISSYGGKTIEVALQLTSDASFESTGWQVYALSFETGTTQQTKAYNPLARSGGNLELNISSVNDDNFPESVFVNFTLEDDSVNVTDLSINDLDIAFKYNGANEGSNCTPKLFLADSTTSTPVDIVFVVDYSGSMNGEINEVKANIAHFVNNLDQTTDPRFGLVRYGYSSNGTTMQLKNSTYQGQQVTMTPDTAAFNDLLTDGTAGGTEWGYTAMDLALSADFRPNAQKIMVIVTDEDANSTWGNNLNQSVAKGDLINNLQQSGIKVYANVPNDGIAPGGYVWHFDTTYADVAYQTGGTRYNITAPFDGLRSEIENNVQATYTLKYCPENTALDTLEHCVYIDLVSDPTVGDNACYGSSPDKEYITRDITTSTLESTAIPENSSPTFCFDVYDNNGPAPVSGTLYARIQDTADVGTSYSTYALSKTTVSSEITKWCATVSSSIVKDPGVEYYGVVEYADGHQLKSPSIDERFLAWTQPVMPNFAPQITYTSGPSGPQCSDFNINFKVTDYTDGLERVDLYYREKNSPRTFQSLNVYTHTGGALLDSMVFNVAVPLAGEGTEYYIVAEDNFGTIGTYGESKDPYLVEAVSSGLNQTSKSMTLDFTGMEIACLNPSNGDSVEVRYENACGDNALAGEQIFVNNTFTVEVYGNDSPSGLPNNVQNGEYVEITYYKNGRPYPLNNKEYNDNSTISYSGIQIADSINFELSGNFYPIDNNDATPSLTDGTDFGIQDSAVTHAFELSNTSCVDLSVKKVNMVDRTNTFTTDYTRGNDTFYVTYLARETDEIQIEVITENNQRYYFTVKGEIEPCGAEIYFNTTLVPDGDTSPSSGEGTDFGSVTSTTTHTFDFIETGVCGGSGISITGVSSNNDQFVTSYSGDEIDIQYLADSAASGTITVTTSESTTYTFDVTGDVASSCGTISVFPNPIPSGNNGLASIQVDVDGTSSVSVGAFLLAPPYTYTPISTQTASDSAFTVLIPNTLSAGTYQLNVVVSNPEPGCQSSYGLQFIVQ